MDWLTDYLGGGLHVPFPGDWIVQAGPTGLLAIVVMLVLLGWLVPRATLKVIERDRDHWRAVALKAMGQTDTLMPAAEISTEVAKALADLSRKQLAVEERP